MPSASRCSILIMVSRTPDFRPLDASGESRIGSKTRSWRKSMSSSSFVMLDLLVELSTHERRRSLPPHLRPGFTEQGADWLRDAVVGDLPSPVLERPLTAHLLHCPAYRREAAGHSV